MVGGDVGLFITGGIKICGRWTMLAVEG